MVSSADEIVRTAGGLPRFPELLRTFRPNGEISPSIGSIG